MKGIYAPFVWAQDASSYNNLISLHLVFLLEFHRQFMAPKMSKL